MKIHPFILESLHPLHEALLDRKVTVVTAESCTGGLVGAALTALPGSSAYYLGGAITYSNEEKCRQTDVNYNILAAHGAVARETAIAMAEGMRRQARATYGLATTGIAGPGGATETKPVGLVWVAVAGPEGVTAREFRFGGDRDEVRLNTVRAALDMLYFALVGTL